MKLRATLLAVLALAFLTRDAAAQGRPPAKARPALATTQLGSFERTLLLTKVRAKTGTAGFGSAQRRALLSTGKLPSVPKLPRKPEHGRSRR